MKITKEQLSVITKALGGLKASIEQAAKVAKETNNSLIIDRTAHYYACYAKLENIIKDISENEYSESELMDKLKEYGNITSFIGNDAIDALNPLNKNLLH